MINIYTECQQWLHSYVYLDIYHVSIYVGTYSGEWCYSAVVSEFPMLIDYADSVSEVKELIEDSIDMTVQSTKK